MTALQILLIAMLIIWLWLGYFLVTRYHKLFGPHPDDPAESPGARSFGIAHIVSVWIGIFALIIYFLIKG